MPKGFVLRLPSAHRRACLSLYRALLKKLNRLVLPDSSTTSLPVLSSLISSGFKRDRTLNSHDAVTSALSRGRALYTLLSSASTNSSIDINVAIKQLEALAITTAATDAESAQFTNTSPSRPPHAHKLKKIAHLENHRSKYWAERIPNPIPVLQRPVAREELPDPTQPRKVPSFIVAHGIPFLRYKSGPQSPVLSRIIRQYNQRDQRRWDRLAQFTDAIDLAQAEDEWDEIISEHVQTQDERPLRQGINQHGTSNRYGRGRSDIEWRFQPDRDDMERVEEASWAAEPIGQMKSLHGVIAGVSAKRRDMGKRMWNIVVQEKRLAEREKVQRKERRRKEWERQQQDGKRAAAAVVAGADEAKESK